MPSVAVYVVEFKFSRGFESYLRSHSTVGRAAPRFDGSGSDAADFTRMAKFCRVLHSFKAKFGILFSRYGISGHSGSTFAARELLRIFQDRGTVIVVIELQDLESVAAGQEFHLSTEDSLRVGSTKSPPVPFTRVIESFDL